MFGEHRLKSGLAKRVSFRTGAIRVAPLRIYGIRSSYLTFNVLIGFTSRRLLKNVYGHCLVGVQVAESRTDKSGYTTGLPGRFVRGSSIFGFKKSIYMQNLQLQKCSPLRNFGQHEYMVIIIVLDNRLLA